MLFIQTRGGRSMRPAVVVLALLLAGPAVAQQPDVSIGRTLALQLCANCHFVEAGQRVPSSVDAPPFPRIASDPATTEFRLRNFLRTPHPVMPMLILSPEETDAVIAFILASKPR
jgi:mono/diheme cytochrome c family protein